MAQEHKQNYKLSNNNYNGGLKSVIDFNNSIKPNSELLHTLKITIPQFFDSNDNFKYDKFIEALHENNITESHDGYKLGFIGKDYAQLQTGCKSETMIAPNIKHNNHNENKNSKNIFITGDNLEALRHLQNAYSKKIKMIYIDPPYNTGKEFVYKDKFEFDDKTLKSALGCDNYEIAKLKSIQGKNSHSAWLTFIYPRLKIARKLLTDDGVIFVSIDDNEQANLKLLMDDVLGERNFIAEFIVIRSEGGGLAKQAVIGHDYLLCYAKNINDFTPLGKPKKIRGKIITKNGEKFWIETDWLRKKFGKYGTCLYEEIEHYLGKEKKNDVDTKLKNNEYVLIKKNKNHIVGRYRKIADDSSKFYTILKHLNKNGVHDLENLGIENLFDFPKPVSLIKELIYGTTKKNKSAVILDFFAGSGTTAQAVMELNAEDGGNRKFIMVQIDEPIKENNKARKAGYNTIDEIAIERIKSAAKKIKSEKSLVLPENFDCGFKHYQLLMPDTKTLNKISNYDPQTKLPPEDNMISTFANKKYGTSGIDTLLTTWLIDDGCRFDVNIKTIKIADYSAFYIEESATLYMIEPNWNINALKFLLNKITKNKLIINTIILYAYSFDPKSIHELETNIKTKLNNPPKIIKRY
ncbi:MAG: site-specific DNA-methyltransferase [Planctomycetaceae bacterium]|jgi:adenine-specific DNA-methyltransferase|nr:site-specific DNA-methyltransferase [Planctomycetaceae bacterium]